MPNLEHWSWQDIIRVYGVFKRIYPRAGEVVNVEEIEQYHEAKARLDLQISILDKEIARRNKLIGVMG